MVSVQLEELFNRTRFQSNSGLKMMVFLLYAPAGCLLVLFRVLVSVQYILLLMLLPKAFFVRNLIMRFYFFVMGVLVTHGSAENREENTSIIVSNHISCLDSIAIEAIVPSWRLNCETNLPSWFCWIFGFKNPDVPWMEDIKSLNDIDSKFPFSFCPEEETTNGKVGLLKFSQTPFKFMTGVVQPIILMSHRPSFMPVNVNYIYSSFWSDLFWILFIPFTQYHIIFLPSREIPKEEDDIEEFVNTLQKDMAYVLDIEATNLTAQDKKEYIKRLKHDERIRQEQILAASQYDDEPTTHNAGRNVEKMITQVKLVLPQVPIAVIRADLKKTENVDLTLTNLLDGTVNYTSLSEEEQQLEKIKSKVKVATKKPVIKPVASFAKTSKDRHLSFQERKRLMLEEAKRKYLEKHPEYS